MCPSQLLLARAVLARHKAEVAALQAQRALADSESLLQEQTRLLNSIFVGLAEGVVVTDEQGNFLLCNHEAQRMLGLEASPRMRRAPCSRQDRVIRSTLSLLALVGCVTSVGCAMETEEPLDVGVSTEALYSSSTPSYLPDSAAVERDAVCNSNEVMTGFCGRVDDQSNFTHVSVSCRAVNNDGTLGSQHLHGDTDCAELSVTADDGWVAVGAAGSVANNNLNLAAIRQCFWLTASKKVYVSQSAESCLWKRNNGSTTNANTISAEKLTDSHAGQPLVTREKRVLRGVGLTASSDEALGRLRIAWGTIFP